VIKPRIAIVPGDPSGVGPELIAKLVNQKGVLEVADVLLVGDACLWRQGARQAEANIPLNTLDETVIANQSGLSHLEMTTIEPRNIRIAKITKAGGVTSLRCLDKALDLAMEGSVDGVLFGPFNKASMTRAGLDAEDEHRYMARHLGFEGYQGEINVLDEIMTTRVTSHMALKDVAPFITKDAVMKAVGLASDTLKMAGNTHPAIAVAALNPHSGDNGKFGREEINVLEPVVAACRQKRMNVTGPWPSDTVFLKARRGEVDAIVTMYHDQGQIAIKLMGFERGVTVAGGLPIPVATPAHGTAFDIAGRNEANPGATRQAFDLLVRMAANHKARREAALGPPQ